jgi:GT2 family glycosyltransferase
MSIAFSIVSHGHGSLILSALEALKASVPGVGPEISVWLTMNIPEPALETAVQGRQWPFKLQFIRNSAPLGFGANHNQAFKSARTAGQEPWFVVLNPDIFLPLGASDFWRLLEQDPWPANVGLLCPVQVDNQGGLQLCAPTDYTIGFVFACVQAFAGIFSLWCGQIGRGR